MKSVRYYHATPAVRIAGPRGLTLVGFAKLVAAVSVILALLILFYPIADEYRGSRAMPALDQPALSVAFKSGSSAKALLVSKGDNYWKESVLPRFEAHRENPTLDSCAAILRELFGISAVTEHGTLVLTDTVRRRPPNHDPTSSKYETVSIALDAALSEKIVKDLTRVANLIHDTAGKNDPASLARLSGELAFESLVLSNLTVELPVAKNVRDSGEAGTSGNREAADIIRAHLKYFTEVGLARETANGSYQISRGVHSYLGIKGRYFRIKIVGKEGHERVQVVGIFANLRDGEFHEDPLPEIPVEFVARRMINAKTCSSPVVEAGISRLAEFKPSREAEEIRDVDFLGVGLGVLDDTFRGF